MRPGTQRAVTSLQKPRRPAPRGSAHLVYRVKESRALEPSTQMTGTDSLRCGGGLLCLFWMKRQSPITQFIYSTQTQFVTG